MPELPPSYEGTQNDDQTRSVDLVPIEPSIKEGTFLVASPYGPGASAPLDRYPPSVITDPSIFGDHRIPNWLTCNEGSWDGSPFPVFEYQWTSDGVDIPGATGKQWLTDLAYENTVIRCRVRGYSRFGEVIVTSSNSIAIERIEAVNVMEEDFATVSGIGAELAQTVQNFRLGYITGRGAEKAQTMMDEQIYYFTGRAADTRLDLNDMKLMWIQGLQSENRLMNLVSDLGVVNQEKRTALFPGYPQPLKILNPGAELGSLGWTTTGSAVTYANNPVPHEGERFFFGGLSGTNLATFSQDIPIDPAHFADVDNGDTFMELYWRQRSDEGSDQVNIYLDFLDASGGVVGFYAGPGRWAAPSSFWFFRSFTDAAIPANTRSIRMTIEFYNANHATNPHNRGMVDSLQANIRKGSQILARDYGPDFPYLRLRFVEEGTYSGAALNELEFGDLSTGGTNLATGGTPLAGSEGLGSSAANAFSGDTTAGDFWAGAENAIADGSSWIGYHFPSSVSPESLTIHGRLGPAANQMGTAWYLEGSQDGSYWVKIQKFNDSEVWENSENRTYEVLQVPQDYGIPAVGSISNGSSRAVKGNIYRMKARLDLTNVKITFSLANLSGRLIIARLEPEKKAIQEILYDEVVVTSGSPGTEILPLNPVVPVEVDDDILIAFARTDGTATSTAGVDVVSGGPPVLDMAAADFVSGWYLDTNDLGVGDVPKSTVDTFLFAIDFQANVF